MIKRILIATTLVGFSIITAYPQAVNKEGLDRFFNALQKNNLSMGSLVIAKNGVPLYSRAIGYSFVDLKDTVLSTTKTKYRIGSISKMFTSVMIFQMIDEGKITLDTRLDKYFPGLPNASRITIEYLLNHRSGLHDYTEDPHFQEWMDKPKTHEELLAIITNAKADFEPGERPSYSSSNYLVLSYIIEKISGQTYKEMVDKRIISKIGLADTYYGSKIDIKKNECYSYRLFNNRWQKQTETDMSIHSGAGSMVSTPADLTKFITALFLNKLISKQSLAKMTTLTEGYGMGIFAFPFNEKMAFGHSGKIEEFATNVRFFPGDSVAISYCANCQVYSKDDVLEEVVNIYYNVPYRIPTFEPVVVTASQLEQYLGIYSSSQMGTKVTCTKDNDVLKLETKGQLFILKPLGDDKFMNSRYGYFFEFKPASKELIIKESDNSYYLKKEE